MLKTGEEVKELLKKEILEDTGWMPVNVNSGFVNNDCRARLKNGWVQVQGQINKSTGNIELGDELGYLPAGIPEPSQNQHTTGASAAADTMKVSLYQDGTIRVTGNVTGGVTIARNYIILNIMYPTD